MGPPFPKAASLLPDTPLLYKMDGNGRMWSSMLGECLWKERKKLHSNSDYTFANSSRGQSSGVGAWPEQSILNSCCSITLHFRCKNITCLLYSISETAVGISFICNWNKRLNVTVLCWIVCLYNYGASFECTCSSGLQYPQRFLCVDLNWPHSRHLIPDILSL